MLPTIGSRLKRTKYMYILPYLKTLIPLIKKKKNYYRPSHYKRLCCVGRSKSWEDAVHWYERALSKMKEEQDSGGDFDSTMEDPGYLLMARMAQMYLEGGNGLDKNPSDAGKNKAVVLWQGCGLPLTNSPNASRIQDWRVKIQTHSPVWRVFFPPLTYTFYIFGQLFSDLARENTELASVLKNLIHTFGYGYQDTI
jgi:hypothetical protein